jgi:NhaA family Na+:H+ antiporter
VGKQAAVTAATWLSVRLGLGALPPGVTWAQIYGVAVLTGVGFTMSLFIGTLAFGDDEHASAVRLGVLTGSLASAALGYIVLRAVGARAARKSDSMPPVSSEGQY